MAGAKTVDFLEIVIVWMKMKKGKMQRIFPFSLFLTGVIIYHTQSCII